MIEVANVEYGEIHSRILIATREEVFPDNASLTIFDGNTALLFPNNDPKRSLVLPPGETSKNWESMERILNCALSLSMGRDNLIVGIGGGVVTDITAFAASLYMRGCRLTLVPTTLLAMVDAAIGGKTGIDFGGMKNLVGTFYPAEDIRICPALLETLPDRVYLSGLVEVIKHAMLNPGGQGGLWDTLWNNREEILNRNEKVLNKLIVDALKVKVEIVSKDLKENGIRSYLNLGHTFAHALESVTNFTVWKHGEAVAWGILRALDMGERLSITDRQWAEECRKLILDYGYGKVKPHISPDELKFAMKNDKKKKKGKLRFVLMSGPGKPVLREVSEEVIDSVLKIE